MDACTQQWLHTFPQKDFYPLAWEIKYAQVDMHGSQILSFHKMPMIPMVQVKHPERKVHSSHSTSCLE